MIALKIFLIIALDGAWSWYSVVTNAMYIVGVFDQILDPRHLRVREEQPPEF